MAGNNATQMTLRRFVKGQLDKIVKLTDWRQMMCQAANEVYRVVGKSFRIEDIQVKVFAYNAVQSHAFTPQQLNDSRLANQQSVFIFTCKGTAYCMACDITRKKFMLSETKHYSLDKKGITLYGLNKPFTCIQASLADGQVELDPRTWKGVPVVDSLKWEYAIASGGKKRKNV